MTHYKSHNNVVSIFTASSRKRIEKGRPEVACLSVDEGDSLRDSLTVEAIMSWVLVILGHILRGEDDRCKD